MIGRRPFFMVVLALQFAEAHVWEAPVVAPAQQFVELDSDDRRRTEIAAS